MVQQQQCSSGCCWYNELHSSGVLAPLQPSFRIWWCRLPTLLTAVSTFLGAAHLCDTAAVVYCGLRVSNGAASAGHTSPSVLQAEHTPFPMCLLWLLCRQCLRVHRGLRRLHPHPVQLLWLPPGGCQPRMLLPGKGWQAWLPLPQHDGNKNTAPKQHARRRQLWASSFCEEGGGCSCCFSTVLARNVHLAPLSQKPKEGWEPVSDNSTRFFTSGTLV